MDIPATHTCAFCSSWLPRHDAITLDGHAAHRDCAVRAKRRETMICVACGEALATAASLVFRGDELIHTGCIAQGRTKATAPDLVT